MSEQLYIGAQTLLPRASPTPCPLELEPGGKGGGGRGGWQEGRAAVGREPSSCPTATGSTRQHQLLPDTPSPCTHLCAHMDGHTHIPLTQVPRHAGEGPEPPASPTQTNSYLSELSFRISTTGRRSAPASWANVKTREDEACEAPHSVTRKRSTSSWDWRFPRVSYRLSWPEP